MNQRTLCKLNHNVKSSKFDTSWNELDAFVKKLTPAVDDHWYSDVLHMPIAISLRHLRNTIEQRLQQKY